MHMSIKLQNLDPLKSPNHAAAERLLRLGPCKALEQPGR